ncbi:MAG: hypothetical protein R3B09_20565 [Nannocystaceae bacterium]
MPANAQPLLRSFGFLTLALYLAARGLLELTTAIPFVGEMLYELYLELWRALVPILGNAFFGIEAPIRVEMTGSGDMTWHYVEAFWLLVAALLGAGAWLGLTRRRIDLARVHAWLRVLLRYWLALALFSYGFAKLLGGQFSPPEPLRLLTTYGDSSPMGLLWTFMGFSPAYMNFTGIAEILAGALLLPRRTTTLGALLGIAVLTNVVLLNFCFDVPVKLYSSTLLLTAIVLAAPDLRRLLSFFVLNKAVAPADLEAPILTGRLRLAGRIGRGFFALVVLGYVVIVGGGNQGPPPAWAPFLGLHEVESFAVDGAVRPPLLTDTSRWRRVYLREWGFGAIESMGGEWTFYGAQYDAEAHKLTLNGRRGEEKEPVELVFDAATRPRGASPSRAPSPRGRSRPSSASATSATPSWSRAGSTGSRSSPSTGEPGPVSPALESTCLEGQVSGTTSHGGDARGVAALRRGYVLKDRFTATRGRLGVASLRQGSVLRDRFTATRGGRRGVASLRRGCVLRDRFTATRGRLGVASLRRGCVLRDRSSTIPKRRPRRRSGPAGRRSDGTARPAERSRTAPVGGLKWPTRGTRAAGGSLSHPPPRGHLGLSAGF